VPNHWVCDPESRLSLLTLVPFLPLGAHVPTPPSHHHVSVPRIQFFSPTTTLYLFLFHIRRVSRLVRFRSRFDPSRPVSSRLVSSRFLVFSLHQLDRLDGPGRSGLPGPSGPIRPFGLLPLPSPTHETGLVRNVRPRVRHRHLQMLAAVFAVLAVRWEGRRRAEHGVGRYIARTYLA
jgi:hypothetical protein